MRKTEIREASLKNNSSVVVDTPLPLLLETALFTVAMKKVAEASKKEEETKVMEIRREDGNKIITNAAVFAAPVGSSASFSGARTSVCTSLISGARCSLLQCAWCRLFQVLIEAVENHMPQVIVIDEIGTKLEAMAASTIAQRGIQLVATAHGITIENLIMNPSLEMLVGGIQSVTLGDEEASRRGVQKTVLERKGPSTFSCAVEIISKTQLRIHRSLEATVDAILSGRFPNVEVRKMKSQEQEEILQKGPVFDSTLENASEIMLDDALERADVQTRQKESPLMLPINMVEDSSEHKLPLRLFCYGILEATVIQAIKQLKMNVAALQLTDNISEANALLSLQSKLKKNSRIQAAFKSHDIPIYVTKTSSLEHVTKAIRALLSDYEDGLIVFGSIDKIKDSEKADALEEARMAIEHVVIPKGEPVDLLPRSYQVVSLQLDLVRSYQLEARRICGESDVYHLRILPSHYETDEKKTSESSEFDGEFDDFASSNGSTNGSMNNLDRLPLLPE